MTSTNNTNTNTNPPGLMLPTQKSFTPGAGNPRDSAMMAGQNMNAKQNALNSSVGGSRRKFRGGAQGSVAVPKMQILYTAQNGNGSNPNDQITKNTSQSMQSRAWAANDPQATSIPSSAPAVGGRRKKHKGGNNPNWNWGCYSGGKRKTYRQKKSRKNRRKTKRHSRH